MQSQDVNITYGITFFKFNIKILNIHIDKHGNEL